MNSITSSNIWFAIDIDTGSTESLPNMYLNDGHIRFTTDNYDPVVTSATYEDTTPVSGVWYKDALKLNGLDDTLINIDIAYGMGYSTLNGWSFSIINKCVNGSPFHKAIIDTTSTYLLGSNITLYVVIDNVFYKRWVGIVSDYAITEDYFKINCDDKFIKNFNLFPKTTIGATNYPNALSDSIGKVIPVCLGDVKYAKPINVESRELNFKVGTSFPLIRVKPDMTTGSFAGTTPLSFGVPNYDSTLNDQFTSYSDIIVKTAFQDPTWMIDYYTIINNKNTCICITMPKTFDTSSLVGKYVSMSNVGVLNADVTKEPKSMKIVSVSNATTPILDAKNTYLVYLIVEGSVDDISDLNNFYGLVTAYDPGTFDEVTDDTMYAYIWDVTNKYVVSQNDVTLINSFNTNDKVISKEGNITCYKEYDDGKVFRFNPLNVTAIDLKTLSMSNGTSEVYHIPESARWLEYSALTDPTYLENLGTTVDGKLLDSTLTWDDDQTDNTKRSDVNKYFKYVTPQPLYNQNSVRWRRTWIDPVNVLAFVMNYNLDTFNPKLYTRVLPTPIWNVGAYAYYKETYPGGGWEVLLDSRYLQRMNSEVYGITDSTFNGKILTASMGGVNAPINRVRVRAETNVPETAISKEATVHPCIPNALSNALTYPDPIDTHDMLGIQYPSTLVNTGYVNNCDVSFNRPKYGHTYPDKDGNYSVYVGGISEQREKMILSQQLSSTVTDISPTLWDTFDENGNISIVLELTAIGAGNPHGWDGTQSVIGSQKTVHLLGLTGYVDYEPNDLYVRVSGECLATVPSAFDLILRVYNGVTFDTYNNLLIWRGSWNVGRQVTEQKNSLDYINELCQQSWVVGWTNRNGNVQLRAIEDRSVRYTHDDNIILRDTIKNFNLTPLTKVCNELSIEADYNAITGKYDKIYSVDNVDQDEFPLGTDGYTSEPFTTEDYTVLIKFTDGVGEVEVDVYDQLKLALPGDVLNVYPELIRTYIGSVISQTWNYSGTNGATSLVITNVDGGVRLTFDADEVSGELKNKMLLNPGETIAILFNTPSKATITRYAAEDDSTLVWKSWVQGVDSYSDAKDIWNTCKNAWYENKTINKYPDALSKLSWFNNRNNFEDTDIYEETAESAYKFFRKAIQWCTRQKYKLVYQIPLTSDTIKVDLMDTIDFHDPILTGFYNGDPSYLNGYVTSLSCKPSQKVIEIELTAEMVYTTPAPMPISGDIIELSTNTDDIIELSTNTDNIIEG